MKTKALMIGLILVAVLMAPLAMAADRDNPRGQRGPRGEGGQFGPRPEAGPQGRFQGPGGPGGVGGDLTRMLLGRLGDRLNLTDEQKEQIKAIVEANKENIEAARKAVQEAMQALHEASEGGVEAEIIAAGKAVGDAFTEQALQRANIAKQVKALLTEEQLKQLEEMKAQMKERMQHRRQGDRQDPRAGRGQGQRSRVGRGEGQGPREGRRGPGPDQDN